MARKQASRKIAGLIRYRQCTSFEMTDITNRKTVHSGNNISRAAKVKTSSGTFNRTVVLLRSQAHDADEIAHTTLI